MIRGVGPVYAKKLVRAFGDKVFDSLRPRRTGYARSMASPVRAASSHHCRAIRKIKKRGSHQGADRARCCGSRCDALLNKSVKVVLA